MLRRPALRALRLQTSNINRAAPFASSHLPRTYASSARPPKPPPASEFTASSKATHLPPKTARTSKPLPKRNPSTNPSGIENQPSPTQGARPQIDKAAAASQSPLNAQNGRQPIAQKDNLDTPPTEGIRDQTQDAQTAAENTAPQQPLPDLRQGIPSTFDMEFGKRDQSVEQEPETSRKGSEEEDYSRADFQTSIDRKRATQLRYTYIAMAAACILGGAYFARPFGKDEDVPASLEPADADGWTPGKAYRRVQARIGDRLGYYTEPSFPKLLPDVPEHQRPPYTLVLSLEDLMVHSGWDRTNGYRMAKRPGIDYFIRYLSPYYELVLFTSVPISIADPVIKKLDPYHFIMWPLGREATKYEKGEFVKDLSYLNRDLKKTLIIDTVAGHVKNQPENAIVLPKWTGDPKDPHTNDLVALIPFLEYLATMSIDDVRTVIQSFEGKDIPTEFARRENLAREKFNAQLATERAKKPKLSLGSVFGGGLGIKADRAGSMILDDGQSVAEGMAQGKMLSDQIREQGQRRYEMLEKQIREQGAQWLKEEEEEQKRLMDEQMKEMKKNPVGTMARWFGGGEPPKND